MRLTLKELMEKLGVGRVLSPYETHPWLHYEPEKGITCSAEVRMGPGGNDVEAEIQFLKDPPEEGEDENSEGDEGSSDLPEQIMRMRIEPSQDDHWTTKQLRVKGEDYAGKIYNWEEKGCEFFRACIQSIQMGELPEIDELIERELKDESAGGGKGRIGRKSPTIKPGQLLGMKK